MQNLLSSHLLSKNIQIRIYKTIILPVALYGYETWSLALASIVRMIRSRRMKLAGHIA
jgi:hypothetical protein